MSVPPLQSYYEHTELFNKIILSKYSFNLIRSVPLFDYSFFSSFKTSSFFLSGPAFYPFPPTSDFPKLVQKRFWPFIKKIIQTLSAITMLFWNLWDSHEDHMKCFFFTYGVFVINIFKNEDFDCKLFKYIEAIFRNITLRPDFFYI